MKYKIITSTLQCHLIFAIHISYLHYFCLTWLWQGDVKHLTKTKFQCFQNKFFDLWSTLQKIQGFLMLLTFPWRLVWRPVVAPGCRRLSLKLRWWNSWGKCWNIGSPTSRWDRRLDPARTETDSLEPWPTRLEASNGWLRLCTWWIYAGSRWPSQISGLATFFSLLFVT